ncbi:glycoside hydrolase family 127 protein [Flagellimonas sp.]|uniref:glycoside hydrolase family 127 protein n=1 Tax=Flagellimonas sp. TaxID=2058762 RepID=UPI003B51C249
MKKILFFFYSILIFNLLPAQEKGLINNADTPYMALKSIDFEDCVWTDGFWAEKQQVCRDAMIPHLKAMMEDPNIMHAYDNFKVAAGLQEGESRGFSFLDGDFYKYVEALAYTYSISKDERIDQLMDEIIDVIAKAQREDGYLHTQIQIGHGIKRFPRTDQQVFKTMNGPFEVDFDHEFYNFGHLMTAACSHYRITGKRNFLDIAIKASDMIYDNFKEPSPELAAIDWNPPHYMGLVEMYRTTGEKKYLELAETFVDMLGSTDKSGAKAHRGLDHSQKRTPFREETEAVGHAGHGNYMYCGVTDIYSETGELALLASLENIWESVANKKMYVHGGTGPNHWGVSRNHDVVSESYGQDYELPNLRAYNETCANIGNAMWNWRMFLLNGDAKFADIMELVFYNSALSGVALDGKSFFYTNPTRFIEGHPHTGRDLGKRSEYMAVFCCPPNIIRTIAKMNNYAYSTSEKGVWVNLYGSNKLNTKLEDGSTIALTQQTNYPWDGNIKITVDTVEKNKDFSLMLRIPGWATMADLKVNGQTISTLPESGSYFDLKRKWKKGDVVEINLPMPAQLIAANPSIEETYNQVAVKRGPLVYCLESVDLPEGVAINEVVIPQDITFQSRFDKNLLAGSTVLEGEAEIFQNSDWSNTLYKPLSKREFKKTKIQLIPYFAWNNRGKTDMSVWLPLKY